VPRQADLRQDLRHERRRPAPPPNRPRRAVLNDYPPATELSTDPRTRSHYQLASTTQYEPGLYGIAVAKDQPRLRNAVKAALDQLIDSGEYAEVLRRWNVADGAVTQASINAGGTGTSN